MKHSIKLFAILFLFSLLACTISYSQKDMKNKVTQLKELPKINAHISPKIEAQIIEIVKPVKDRIEKLYNEDATGNYASYSSDIERLGKITDSKEKNSMAQKMQKKYYPFVKKIWDQAKIDEDMYKQKLINLFPANVKETIRFGEFLNFTMGSSYQKPPPPPAPPAPAPEAPKNICVNANSLFRGTFGVDGGAIGGTRVQVAPANPPSPAEIVAGSTAAVLGFYRCEGWLHNTVSMPGTFPLDNKLLRSTKRFDWRGSGVAFTLLGCAWATVAYTTDANTTDFNVSGEIYSVVAPVTFIQVIDQTTSKTEESVIPKTDLKSVQFGITCFASASSSIFLSFGNATSSCAMWKWDICEE
jgi:hypothetical protein